MIDVYLFELGGVVNLSTSQADWSPFQFIILTNFEKEKKEERKLEEEKKKKERETIRWGTKEKKKKKLKEGKTRKKVKSFLLKQYIFLKLVMIT